MKNDPRNIRESKIQRRTLRQLTGPITLLVDLSFCNCRDDFARHKFDKLARSLSGLTTEIKKNEGLM